MLTILVGTDTEARAKRLAALLAPLRKNGTEVQTYSDVTFEHDAMRAVALGISLFGGTLAVVISGLGDVPEKRDQLERLIPELVASPHHFIVSESALLAAFTKKVEAKGGMVEEFKKEAKGKKAEVFNAFQLTDAFSDRKRSLAWPLYRKAIDLGVEPRELHGKIFWAVKTMLLAKNAKTAAESGLNPFVYQKAKRGAANFAPGELERILEELAVLFHEALVSGIDLESGLEAFILRVLAK